MARRVLSCRPSMVVHSFPRLSLRLLLSDGLGLIDSLLTHAHKTQRNTRLENRGAGTGGRDSRVVLPRKALELTTNTRTGPGPH